MTMVISDAATHVQVSYLLAYSGEEAVVKESVSWNQKLRTAVGRLLPHAVGGLGELVGGSYGLGGVLLGTDDDAGLVDIVQSLILVQIGGLHQNDGGQIGVVGVGEVTEPNPTPEPTPASEPRPESEIEVVSYETVTNEDGSQIDVAVVNAQGSFLFGISTFFKQTRPHICLSSHRSR